jgi:hypothetical protein
MNAMVSEGGAIFYDRNKRLRGTASRVSERKGGLSKLTSIDVDGADAALAEFLIHLDRSNILVRDRTTESTLYEFRWASGYSNGNGIRIQGMLEGR